MNKIMSMISFLLIAVFLVVVVLKMSGNGELVDKAGSDLVKTLKLGPSKSKSDAVKNMLGWDITEIKNKPVATVREGKNKLLKIIDDLEAQRLKNKISTTDAGIKNKEAQKEQAGLKDSIVKAKACLDDPATTYPVTIKGVVYADKSQLERATVNAIKRYNVLKSASPLGVNTLTYGNEVTILIEKRLDIARQILELLNRRLALAEIQENEIEFKAVSEELAGLEATARTIVSDGEDAVRKLPAGATSESEYNAGILNSFKE